MPQLPLDLQKQYTELLSLTRKFLQEKDFDFQHIQSHPEAFYYFQKISSSTKEPIKTLKPAPILAPPSQNPPLHVSPALSPIPSKRTLSPQEYCQPQKNEPIEKSKPLEVIKDSLKAGFKLEPVTISNELDIKEFAPLLRTHMPHYPIRDQIPQNTTSRSQGQKSSTIAPIVILSFYTDEPSQTFLKNLARAIEGQGFAAQVFSAYKIEQERKWESLLHASELRLILAAPQRIQTLPHLLKYYHSSHLHQTELLPLFDPEEYLHNPSLKSPLWKAILQKLSSLVKES